MELDSLSAELKERIEQIGPAELVVGLLTSGGGRAEQAIEALRMSQAGGQFPSMTVAAPADAFSNSVPLSSDRAFRVLPLPSRSSGSMPGVADSLSDACRTVFTIGKNLQARACAIVGSDWETFSPDWIHQLVRPVLDLSFDLILPLYAWQRFDGLLTSSILCPLTSTLYGRRIRWPNAADLGLSARMIDCFLAPDPPSIAASRRGPTIWMTTEALCRDFSIGETQLGIRMPATREPADLSSVISQLLGPLFVDMTYRATCWQQIRTSQPVAAFGADAPISNGTETVDVRPMVEAFHLAFQNLQEVWGLILPPATLFELKKLTALSVEQFRLPDQLWARIVYDFALGHRLKALNRDQLLRALTPVYRAWLASYAMETQNLDAAGVARRFEKLCRAYDSEKSYLVSRWRWPDRFSP